VVDRAQRGRVKVDNDEQWHLLAASGAVPPWLRALKHIAFEPGGLVAGVAGDRVDAGYLGHHSAQVPAAT
jgi:hypothetical protein